MREINEEIAHFEWESLRKDYSLEYGLDDVSIDPMISQL